MSKCCYFFVFMVISFLHFGLKTDVLQAQSTEWTQAYFDIEILESEYGDLSIYFIGIGRSKKSQKEADERAFENIGKAINTQVNAGAISVVKERNAKISDFFKSESRQTSNTNLVGIAISKRTFNPDDKYYYALAIITKDEYYRNLRKATSSGIPLSMATPHSDSQTLTDYFTAEESRFLTGKPVVTSVKSPINFPSTFINASVVYSPFFLYNFGVSKSIKRFQIMASGAFNDDQSFQQFDATLRYHFLSKKLPFGTVVMSGGGMMYSDLFRQGEDASDLFTNPRFTPQFAFLFSTTKILYHRLNVQIDSRSLIIANSMDIISAFTNQESWLKAHAELITPFDRNYRTRPTYPAEFNIGLTFQTSSNSEIKFALTELRYPVATIVLR